MDECGFATFATQRGLDATISLRPGEFLFREGDEADALHIVSRGTLRITSGSAVYEVVQSGVLVGEIAFVANDMARSASVIAGTFAELIRIDSSLVFSPSGGRTCFFADGHARDGTTPQGDEPALPSPSHLVMSTAIQGAAVRRLRLPEPA